MLTLYGEIGLFPNQGGKVWSQTIRITNNWIGSIREKKWVRYFQRDKDRKAKRIQLNSQKNGTAYSVVQTRKEKKVYKEIEQTWLNQSSLR